ncbi:MAG: peptide-methionine (S)-S-oxide reductase MsrA [Planctomycetales bacterium]|nr:peptide-methionine (S)-S-oxide reductase MsrA [Planctomycetales bacterium]NIM08670.1 peptide-methionine (S)-S-oxide reductase MsrA [Planctomycetales bacterium]NIN08144.1 peptide-methionine (S)-S-oxide reductase MsrA [Planctomycetales bacterium]NIN77271.1 peptide-methionine (S)-S-oxide reductase MsrA [Planctomycetales bacterium]NIO34455.1 peptide-methionine (S)-S-oxide reductase MsrA [Planctomycetales bacterium]
MEKATFGAGCFWGVEAAFQDRPGVIETAVGYSGGTWEKPTYQDVCSGTTGHAEVVQIQFDPTIITYETLLDIFWNCHDPTTLNRQGPDVGSQYRSAIFYHTPQQEELAGRSKQQREAEGRFPRPIVTQIESAVDFWRAEEYHQRYLEKHGMKSCHGPGQI